MYIYNITGKIKKREGGEEKRKKDITINLLEIGTPPGVREPLMLVSELIYN